ncbi:DUF1758 domain-containing protein [Trichonephila clavipes]|nr:DUF1758 domain-containing protein [Trichonephila clavipes]
MYETKFFWEDKPSDLKNNWAIAKRSFDNLKLKMKDNSLYNEYINIVKDQIKENIVEECFHHISKIILIIISHAAVVRKDEKTTKVRMVFDASSKGRDCKSLNECLYAGPPLNPE